MDGYVRSVEVAEELLNEVLEAEREWVPSYWFKG